MAVHSSEMKVKMKANHSQMEMLRAGYWVGLMACYWDQYLDDAKVVRKAGLILMAQRMAQSNCSLRDGYMILKRAGWFVG